MPRSRPNSDEPLARRFRVGVTARGGVDGGGRLSISPGRLVCEYGLVTRRVSGLESIRHHGTVVHLYRAWLIPPWYSVGVVIDDGENVCLASKSVFGLRTLVDALTGEGFQVEVHRTWVFRGLHRNQMVWGAREPGKGAAATLGPTVTERALRARRTLLLSGVLVFCAVIAVLWVLGGATGAILAGAFGLVGLGITIWHSWSLGPAPRK